MISTWIAALLTLCVFSFLYKDQPVLPLRGAPLRRGLRGLPARGGSIRT